MIWLGDPLHRLPIRWRWCAYGWLAAHFLRLAAWHWLDDRFGRP